MKLYRRELVRGLRRRVQQEVQARPEWRREARFASRQMSNRQLGPAALRWIVFLVLAGLVYGRPPAHGLWLVLVVWAGLLTFLRAAQFQQFWAQRNGVWAFLCLPVTTEQVYGVGVSRMFRSSLWLIGDMLTVLGLAIPLSVAPTAWFGVLPVILLYWLSVLATAMILLWHWPRTNFSLAATGLLVLCGALAFGADHWKMFSVEQVEGLANFLLWGTPPGWACQLARWLTGDLPTFPWIPLLGLGVLLPYGLSCYRRELQRVVLWEPDSPLLQPNRAEEWSEADVEADREEAEEEYGPPLRSRVSEVEDYVSTGRFLHPFFNFYEGWIERLILSRLQSHAAVLDFVLGPGPGWSRAYFRAVKTLVMGALLTKLALFWNTAAGLWVGGLSLALVLGFTTPVFGGLWQGLQLGPMGNRQIALLALLPVGLREVRRVILTINALRFILALPVWISAAAAIAYFVESPLLTVVSLALKLWLIDLLLQPFFFMTKCAKGTTLRGFLLISGYFLACLLLVAVVGAALFAIAVPLFSLQGESISRWWQVGAFAGLALTSFGAEFFYRKLYAGFRFDLLAPVGRSA